MCKGNVVLSDLCQVYNNYGKIKKLFFKKVPYIITTHLINVKPLLSMLL